MSEQGHRTGAARVVAEFLRLVRSGEQPDRAGQFMAPTVAAHQLTSEGEATVLRTPDDYADHVREMLAQHGEFHFEVLHLCADGDRVAVMWRQRGGSGAAVTTPSGAPLVEIAAAVYRVSDDRIVEYWLLIDRLGIERQLASSD